MRGPSSQTRKGKGMGITCHEKGVHAVRGAYLKEKVLEGGSLITLDKTGENFWKKNL